MQTKETHSLTAMGRAAALRIEPAYALGASPLLWAAVSPSHPLRPHRLPRAVSLALQFFSIFFFWCRLPGETGFMESMAFTSFCLFPIKTGIRESDHTESLCWRCPAEGPVSPNARHVKEEASGLLLLQPLPGQSLKGLG